MVFVSDYILFLSKFVTAAVLIVIVVAAILALASKAKGKGKSGKLTIRNLNEYFDEMSEVVNTQVQTKAEKKAAKKKLKLKHKQHEQKLKKDGPEKHQPRLFVIDFNGDMRGSRVDSLREEITAVLLTATPGDRVLVRLESPGGVVHAYGLAASQLQRLKAAGIKFTVAVDKVAASGGYMMACIADEVIAAPFAIVGSIGVIAQLPNVNRLLDKNNIDVEQITGGKYKRTLTVFGKNTDEGRNKMQSDVDDTHELFKEFIHQHRPQVDLEQAATGEHWYASRAEALKLVDKLQTSDDFLLASKDDYALYQVEYQVKQDFSSKVSNLMHRAADKLLLARSKSEQYFY